jgi:hypothetical protein
MRKELLLLATALFCFGIAPIGCKKKPAMTPAAGSMQSAAAESSATAAPNAPATAMVNFAADLTGTEVIPPLKTKAAGSAKFQLSADSTQLGYEVTVNDLRGLTEIHLHQGAMGKSGDVVAWLYPEAPPAKEIKGMSSGTVAKGTLDASRLAGPMKGMKIKDLAAAIMGDSIYVMVHTKKHREGELRGQVKVAP